MTVVIFTNYLSDLDAHHALQSGVIDFFEKKELDDSDGEEKLFARMVYAVGKTRHAMLQQQRISRLKWVCERKERQDAPAKARNCVSTELGRSYAQLDRLAELLGRDYGLNAEESVSRELAALKESLHQLPESLWKLFPFDVQAATYKCIDVAGEDRSEWPNCGLAICTGTLRSPGPRLIREPRAPRRSRKTYNSCWRRLVDPLERAAAGSPVEIKADKSADGNDIIVSVTERSAPRTKPWFSTEREQGRTGGNRGGQGLQLLKGVAHNMSASFDRKDNGDSITLTLTLPVMNHG